MTSATEKAVAQLKAYGKYIYDHAENIRLKREIERLRGDA